MNRTMKRKRKRKNLAEAEIRKREHFSGRAISGLMDSLTPIQRGRLALGEASEEINALYKKLFNIVGVAHSDDSLTKDDIKLINFLKEQDQRITIEGKEMRLNSLLERLI